MSEDSLIFEVKECIDMIRTISDNMISGRTDIISKNLFDDLNDMMYCFIEYISDKSEKSNDEISKLVEKVENIYYDHKPMSPEY
jgi:hypothetical protein